jgi:signal transduction histidine kinase
LANVRRTSPSSSPRVSNAEAPADLFASRARLLTAGDDAHRRVVRDLHDGAQQSLVQVIMTLQLVEHALQDGDKAAKALVGEALDQAQQANTELRELAHGILPAVLAHLGLAAGALALVSRLRVPVKVDLQVERWFGLLTDQLIRRGVHKSVVALEEGP